ncbi:MAG: glycoside hydrolase family 44 protein [Polyangiales bacterium]
MSPAVAGRSAGTGGATAGRTSAGSGGSAGLGGRNAGGAGAAAGAGAGAGAGGAAANGGAGGTGPAAGSGALDAPLTPGDPGAADITVEVRTDLARRAISPAIYGTNGAPDGMRTRPTVVRSGGNRMTAYNWENNASNAGSDYMFQNDNYLSSSSEPAKPILDGLAQAAMLGADSIVTVPLVDYVAGDTGPGGDVRNSGTDYLTTRFKRNLADKPSAVAAAPDVSDDAVYEDEFVAYLKAHAPSGTRLLFSLDNEPDLWSHTHAEVHPLAVTYAELWERNQRYASAIKRVWADAPVLGFVSYGWAGYTTLQSASDAMNRDFIDWYLDQASAAESGSQKRLIDYLDLHWYPEALGGGVRITVRDNSEAVVAAREQAPRSLWDTTYEEDSWIRNDAVQGPLTLVPRLLAKIAAHYPGTKLAFTEWNYGGGDHISGAIACADVLGILGREGVALATYWPLIDNETFAYAAFRAFRNYDGMGATFGDTALATTTSDVQNLTAYASVHEADPNRVVIIAINKSQAAQKLGLKLAHPTAYTKLTPYSISGTAAELTAQTDQTAVATNAWNISLPAQSVTVLVPRP